MRSFDEQKDSLRLYNGDTRIRNTRGYLISGNQSKINTYKLVNMFLFTGMENEVDRTFGDGKYLPRLQDITEILNIYEDIINLSETYNNLPLFRIERSSTIKNIEEKGYIPSFWSCRKENFCEKFLDKNAPIRVEIAVKGAFAVDVENVLGREYLKTDEKEVVLLPFQKIQISYDTEKETNVPIQCDVMKPEKVNILDDSSIYLKRIYDEDAIKNTENIIKKLNDREQIMCDEQEKYLQWKYDIQQYVYLLMQKRINSYERMDRY